ncbi:MAG: dTDP-4-dehydrorhamnose 3,5-epimerase family protein [bacterium]
MLNGVKEYCLKKNNDDRGYFIEMMRADWRSLLDDDIIQQANFAMSHYGVIRAWHRHLRGQVDYITVLKGAIKLCVYDDIPESATHGQIDELIVRAEDYKIIRVPGQYWHGYKCIDNAGSQVLYFANKLYDYQSPDEARRPWDDTTVLDPKTNKPYIW